MKTRVWIIEWQHSQLRRWIPIRGEMFTNFRDACYRKHSFRISESGNKFRVTEYIAKDLK